MNANVIVLVPAQDGRPLTEQAGAVPNLDVWWWRVGQGNGNAHVRQTSPRETNPPLWTWFIENPRSCGA